MDEEKEQKNGQASEPKGVLDKGAKKLGKQTAKKFFRKVIIALLPKLLMSVAVILGTYLMISAISHFLDILKGEESKKSGSSAIVYSSGNSKVNKITASTKNVTDDGAYKLTYKFKNEDKKVCSDEEAIKIIKKNLLKENEKIDLTQFSDSELKIIGTLMNNGLETGQYSEKQLKALAIFVKADIAAQSFDLSNGEGKKVNLEDLSKNDEVYGTLELHKTTPTDNGYEEIKLKYVPYSTFKSMMSSGNQEALKSFSINSKGNIIIAKASSSSIKFKYVDGNGSELSEADKGKIDEENIEEDKETYSIKEYAIPIDYKQYISKYIVNYGFLSDLLIATNNVDFCLEIAELALKSKIVINLREEKTTTYIYDERNYTQTTLIYAYVDYKVTEYKTTSEQIASGTGDPNISPIPKQYGYNSRFDTLKEGETKTYTWTYQKEDYKLEYSNKNKRLSWVLYREAKELEDKSIESGNNVLIKGGHEDTINEDYTGKEEFNYTIIMESSSVNYKYDIDISEIDGWFLTYKRPYAPPNVSSTEFDEPSDVEGEYPEEATVVQAPTTDAGIINSNKYVQAFIKSKEQAYNNNAKCTVTKLAINKKSKTSSKVAEYNGTRTTYSFGDEADIDTTKVEFKNMEYMNGLPTYTSNGKEGFLFIYNKYITAGIDLCLHNDSEKKFFELLESDETTVNMSDIMKFLLYVYDGIDRGVTDLDKTFKIVGMSLNKGGIGASAFGCPLTKEEFLEATRQHQGDSILAGLADKFYDICTLPEYNVNPCIAYVWAAFESDWGSSATEDHNLFQIGTYTDMTHGSSFASYDDAIHAFCKILVSSAKSGPGGIYYDRAQEFAQVNSKFKGTPADNIYALFSAYAWAGYTHTGNARACLKYAYDYLNNGVNLCNHKDSDPVTLEENAYYMEYIITSRIDYARVVFGKDCFLGHGSIVEAAYEVADHFMNGIDVHYAAAHKNGNNIKLPDAHNIQACYDKPVENPSTWGIVCTTFVNLAIWKAGLIDEETLNTYNLHSPFYSDIMLKSMDGWEVITNFDDLQEGDVVYSDNHTWIYMEGGKMLDQSYCVINPDGSDTRGVLKNANRGAFIRGFRYVGS